jgi:nitrate reductase beta subunit
MSITWHDAYEKAISETKHGIQFAENPTQDDFMELFEAFYDEITSTNRISSYPVDPPSSRRMAKSRARVVWADDIAQ